jgi:hypothetical protein
MPYYPLSQIKSNLYTNGDEYVLSTTKELYVGYYYEVSDGKKYTGKTPQDGPNIRLIPYLQIPTKLIENTDGKVIEPFNLITPDSDNPALIDPLNKRILNGLSYRFIPSFNPTIPTQQDYSIGVFTRYFCKKNNENIYLEIDEKTYKNLFAKVSTIAWDLYTPVLTQWYLTGNKDTVAKANKGLIDNIERTKQWYGFSQYFKGDFLKYYLGS